MKEFNCVWSQGCKTKQICCCFCDKKSCEWRCNDNPQKCKYKSSTQQVSIKVEEPIKIEELKERSCNEVIDNNLRETLKSYQSKNRIDVKSLAELIGIGKSLVRKLLSDYPLIHARTESYNKIKDFIKKIKEN